MLIMSLEKLQDHIKCMKVLYVICCYVPKNQGYNTKSFTVTS